MQDQIRERAYFYYVNGSTATHANWLLAEKVQELVDQKDYGFSGYYETDNALLEYYEKAQVTPRVKEYHLPKLVNYRNFKY